MSDLLNSQGKPIRPRPVISRAWVVEGPGGPRVEPVAKQESKQLDSGDPFVPRDAAESGLERPPYDMDALVGLMGGTPGSVGNSLHTRCVKQKAGDAFGRGFQLRAKEEDKGEAQEEDRWGEFVESVETDERGDGSFSEHITRAHQDFESIGWGVIEIGRNAEGVIDGLWHVPAHTVRAHKDGRRFAQKRGDKTVWFKRFGIEGTVDARSGGFSERTARAEFAANELVVVKNYTPTSSFYGLPDHIPALSAMAGWTAQAEFNIRFFGNQAVPSYAVIVEGADITPELEEDILDHFERIKGDPARTIIIPVPGNPGMGEQYQPKLRFERLSVEVKEASFRMYRQDAALEICISHGVPPYRIGWPIVGSLGGATAEEMTHIYNDTIIQVRQETWEQRLNRALFGPMGLEIQTWTLKANELDVRNEMRDLEKAERMYAMGVVTPADNAKFFGREREGPGANDYIAVPLAPQAGTLPTPDDLTKQWADEVAELGALRQRIEKLMRPSDDGGLDTWPSAPDNGEAIHLPTLVGAAEGP